MSQQIVLSLRIDPVLAQYIGSTSCENFLESQPDRFEVLHLDGVEEAPPVHVRALLTGPFEHGTLTWCGPFSDVLMLRAYEQACGFETALLWDLASMAAPLPSGGYTDGHVLLSSRPFKTH